MATNYIRYIDVDAAAGGDGTTAALTGANCAFQSLALAEGAGGGAGQPPLDLGAANDTVTFTCGSNHASTHTADTTALAVSGWTFGGSAKMTIKSDANSRAGMVYSATKYRFENTETDKFSLANLAGSNIEVDGLQIRRTNLTASATNSGLVQIPDGQTVVFKNCHIRCDYTGSTYYAALIYGATAFTSAGTFALINCVVVNRGTSTNAANLCLKTNSSTITANLYSCMFAGGRIGVRNTAGTINAKNCIATNTGFADWYGTITKTNCASEDTTADGTNPVTGVAHSTSTYVSVTGGSEDFSLQSGAAVRNVGVDTSGESAPFNFTTDIRAYTRSGSWDIGPWDYDAAAPAGGGATNPPWIPAVTQGGPI